MAVLAQMPVVQGLISHQPFEPCVFPLQAPIDALPAVESLLSDAMLPAQRRCSDPCFVFFEDADELVLGELASSHCVLLGDSPRENAHDAWTNFRGEVNQT